MGFAIHWQESAMGVYVPHLEHPSHLSPHPITQGFPTALALSALFHAWNLDWWSISHMVIYMFQYYSLKSSQPHLLPEFQEVVLYICVSFAVSHIGSSLVFWNITMMTPKMCFFPPSVLLGTWWLGLFNLKTHMPPTPRNQFHFFANFLSSIFPVPFLDVLLVGF